MELHKTFAALGDPTRFAIVQRLLEQGELNAGTLQTDTTISAPAFSRHLKVLRQAGIIKQRVDAQKRLYSVQPQAVKTIHQWTIDHQKFWEASLTRLEAALMQEKDRK